ncbi:hypothetical protein Tco_1245847 [Tanacetum coccineum]
MPATHTLTLTPELGLGIIHRARLTSLLKQIGAIRGTQISFYKELNAYAVGGVRRRSHNQRNKGDLIRLDFESEDTEVQDLGIAKGKEVLDEDLGKPFKEARRIPLTR